MSDIDGDDVDYFTSCVSCGRRIPVKNRVPLHHECSKSHEAALKAANTRAYDDVPTRRQQLLGNRLETGFEMLSDDDPKDVEQS